MLDWCQERHGDPGGGPAEACYVGQSSRVYLSPGKTERVEPVQPQDVKTARGPHQYL